MPGPLDQISFVVVGYAGLVLLVAAYSSWRWRERPPWLDSMAWMLEVLLGIRAIAGLGAMASGDRPDSVSTHVGYLLASVCVVPLALGSMKEDRGPWSIGVLAVAVVAVGVISVRMMVTL
jgi:heme A synthase